MRKRKIKPGSFQDLAEARAIFTKDKRIDLRKYWNEEELDPDRVNRLQNAVQDNKVCRS
jgi:hypothetical protein